MIRILASLACAASMMSMPSMMSTMSAAEHIAIGLTPAHTVIEGLSIEAASAELPRVLLIGGNSAAEAQRFDAMPLERRRFQLLAIPEPNPDHALLVFPPTGAAYKDNAESHYLWRWIGTHAPDFVLIGGDDFGLAQALSDNSVAGIGRIPARRVDAGAGMLKAIPKRIAKSEARLEIERRIARSPRQVAEELARYYGHDFESPVYIPGMALIGQMRLGHVAEVERIVSPYVDGSKDSLAKATSSHTAGHLVFAELARRTGDARYTELVRKAADIAMPLHNEMSDAVFMGCPILAAAGRFDDAERHLRFMQKLCLRADGLYRHSPLNEAAWGRGNAFPALGLAWALSEFPKDHAAYAGMVHSFQEHMAALAPFQNGDGLWREVIDVRGAYPEFSATAMIAVAMLRGIRNGWLPVASYQPRIDKAWRAISARTGSDGRLIDVCESTGKQKSLDDYLRRTAILDRDPRGGGMALLLATELLSAR